MPRTELAALYNYSVFNFRRNVQTPFQTVCTILHSHQQHMRVPTVSHSLQPLVWSVFLTFIFEVSASPTSSRLNFSFPKHLVILIIFHVLIGQ